MKDEKIFYKTSNLNLATTLYTLGFPINGIYEVENTTIREFYFEHTPKLERTVDDYWTRKLKVEPNTLLTNRKELLEHLNAQNIKKSGTWTH